MPFVKDEPPPLGSILTVYVDQDSEVVRRQEDSSGTYPGCRVIAVDSDGDVWVGWLSTDTRPNTPEHANPMSPLFAGITRQLISNYKEYPFYEMLGKAAQYVSIDYWPAGTKEKPCPLCQRNNDLGIKTCWFCGTQDPTA